MLSARRRPAAAVLERLVTGRTSWAVVVVISQRVCMSIIDMRSDLSHRQRACGDVATENVNVVADQADRARSGTIPISAYPLEVGAN